MTDDVILDENIVRAEWGCPGCGERRMDELIWVDDVTVECQTCGIAYEPGKKVSDDAN